MIQNVLLIAFSRLVFPEPSWPTTTSVTVEFTTGSSCSESRYWRTSAARSGKSDGMLMRGLPANVMRRSRLRADTETGSCDSLLLFTRSSSSRVNRPMSTGSSTNMLSLHCMYTHTYNESICYSPQTHFTFYDEPSADDHHAVMLSPWSNVSA